MFFHRQAQYKPPSDPIVGSSQNLLSKFYLCEPTNFYYKAILSIHQSNTQIDAMPEYILENRQTTYIVPVSGNILSAEIFPEDTVIQLNGEKVTSLFEQSIKVGDKLVFLKNKDEGNFNGQLVICCALESDERR